MKKFIVIVFICLFCSCTVEKTEVEQQHIEPKAYSLKYRSLMEAIDEANNSFNQFFPETKSSREIDSAFFVTSNISDTLLIVVNYSNNSGFALVAAEQSETPILGIFERGSFLDSYNNNPAFKLCYEEILANQADAQKKHLTTRSSEESYDNVVSTITSNKSLGPFVTVNWGQRAPFNLYCPNSIAGCTPIAIAQAMSYFEYPNALSITYTDTIASPIRLNWREMKAHSNNAFCSPLCNTCKTLSHLLREIGHRCNASYNTSSTGAWPYAEFLSKFRYQCKESSSFNLDDIDTYLGDYRLTLLCGFSPSNTGHTWVVDGIKTTRYTNTYYLENLDGSETEVFSEDCKDTYLHFNFGWYGSGNGYVLCQTEVNRDGTITYPKTLFSGTYTDIRLQISNFRSNAAREL